MMSEGSVTRSCNVSALCLQPTPAAAKWMSYNEYGSKTDGTFPSWTCPTAAVLPHARTHTAALNTAHLASCEAKPWRSEPLFVVLCRSWSPRPVHWIKSAQCTRGHEASWMPSCVKPPPVTQRLLGRQQQEKQQPGRLALPRQPLFRPSLLVHYDPWWEQ
jgi:hypothetical protein